MTSKQRRHGDLGRPRSIQPTAVLLIISGLLGVCLFGAAAHAPLRDTAVDRATSAPGGLVSQAADLMSGFAQEAVDPLEDDDDPFSPWLEGSYPVRGVVSIRPGLRPVCSLASRFIGVVAARAPPSA